MNRKQSRERYFVATATRNKAHLTEPVEAMPGLWQVPDGKRNGGCKTGPIKSTARQTDH